jgi:hypothetical protein
MMGEVMGRNVWMPPLVVIVLPSSIRMQLRWVPRKHSSYMLMGVRIGLNRTI